MQALNNPALDIWDCGDLIMYQYWYNIALLQEIYWETVGKFIFISLEWNKVSLSRLKSLKTLSRLKSPWGAQNRFKWPKDAFFFCQFCLSRLKSP